MSSESQEKSKKRAAHANDKICSEMLELCEMVNRYGTLIDGHGNRKRITFGELFNIYLQISGKLVGILLRARKHNLVAFEGECLFQGKDDDVIIELLQPIKKVRMDFKKNTEAMALRQSNEM